MCALWFQPPKLPLLGHPWLRKKALFPTPSPNLISHPHYENKYRGLDLEAKVKAGLDDFCSFFYDPVSNGLWTDACGERGVRQERKDTMTTLRGNDGHQKYE